MKDVCLLITIVQRAQTDEFTDFFREEIMSSVYSTPCSGTVRSKTLDLLGMEKTEKSMIYSVMSGQQMRRAIRGLTTRMQIDLPDRGIALAVPLSSVGGRSTLNYLFGEEAELTEREDEKAMNEHDYELIVAIIEKGHTDMVMEAARQAGAGGGTVIRAKGTGGEHANKFLSVSIAEEKEMIFIVAHAKQKKAIMQGIMHDAGLNSPAHTLLFSIPVLETAGFRLFDANEEQ